MRPIFHRRQLQRFTFQEKGVAAVEFALILPVMLATFVGVTEVGQAVSISRKVTVTTRTVTDLVTQNSTLSALGLQTILQASAEIITPYSSSTLNITVSEISTDSSGKATVTWSGSWPNNNNALTVGSPFLLPTNLDAPNISLIYGQTTYGYTPVLGDQIIGVTTLSDHIYLSPRESTSITLTN